MSEASAALPAEAGRPRLASLTVRVGWRNLWRNRRRTWLTSGGIAFAILLVVFSMAFQFGQYDVMIDTATSLLTGHVQVQSGEYVENDRFEHTIRNAEAVRRVIEATPGVVAAAPRVEAFALASVGERSFGALVVGMDVAAERNTVRFLDHVKTGRAMQSADEAIVGTALARNLGLSPGDEIVVLGSGKEGGVAALVVTLVGIFETGVVEIDRGVLAASYTAVQNAFGLGDEAHTFAVRIDDLDRGREVAQALRDALGAADGNGLRVRLWDEVLPELRQGIEVDRIGGQIFYYIVLVLVAFTVVNSFIMTVFERTREFGMLLAIGMRPLSVMAMLQWEALFVWLLGAAIGLTGALALVLWLADVGIYLGEDLEQMASQWYMPSRLYPTLLPEAFITSPAVLLVGSQLAALVSSVRLLRLKPVDALRST